MSAKPNDQSVTDDQELAKVLAGNSSQQKNDIAEDVKSQLGGLQFEESPVPANQQAPKSPTITPSPSAAAASAQKTTAPQQSAGQAPSTPSTPAPATQQQQSAAPGTNNTPTPTQTASTAPTASGSSSLDNLKRDALEELRPLVDKLNLPAEEKFDTLLLIIRSTDDQSLLDAAHNAAKSIQDDSRRAQALLDVIKEIDFFSGQGQA